MTDVPDVIQAWVRQLLDPAFVEMVVRMDAEQLDVRLSASRGKVRKNPTVILNGGPQTFVDL